MEETARMDQASIGLERKRQDMDRYDNGLTLLEDRTKSDLQSPTQPPQELSHKNRTPEERSIALKSYFLNFINVSIIHAHY
jgi:hypothetical protein